MKLFISWSGERSKLFAQALYEWLPMVLQSTDPWVSHAEIAAGDRWSDKIAKELEVCNFGIICMTRENIASPWILFEAGALAKLMQEGRVIPLLLDIEFKDVTGPLAQFQAKKAEKEGLLDVVNAINQVSDTKISDTMLPRQFEVLWPTLEKAISEIPKNPAPAKQHRPQQEILEELVSSIRGLDMRFRDISDEPERFRRKRYRVHPMMVDELIHRLEFDRNDPVKLLIISSFFKDELPWLYEMGLEAYHAARTGNRAKTAEAQARLTAMMRMIRRGPFSEFVRDDYLEFLIRELGHSLEDSKIRPKPQVPTKSKVTDSLES